MNPTRWLLPLWLLIAGSLSAGYLLAQTDESQSPSLISDTQREFFESKIRPVLIEHCYDCHNTGEVAEGGFAVDHRQALLRGGDGGVVVVPKQPGQSRLIKILRHEIDGLEMPEGGPKLEESVVRDFERWIAMGVPDPRDQPPTDDEVRQATSWDQTLERRKKWWSFQPIAVPEELPDRNAATHPIDQFLNREIEQAGLKASPPADAATLVRRLYFALTGLPPTADEAADWTERIDSTADRQAVVSLLVDQLLESPRFGERWARHWMDWIRYAESHGSEGDPRIENAWQYRDYLIRALNGDVSYRQLIREHLAGDLIDAPRINRELGINESAIGTAHWRMVFHGFAPTDALDEKVRFIDDQINVMSKAFLGLTVSCARCHDHKFDAISQADYYALFGVLSSCRPGRNVVDLPERQNVNRRELEESKNRIRELMARRWLAETETAAERLWQLSQDKTNPSAVAATIAAIKQQTENGRSLESAWGDTAKSIQATAAAVESAGDSSQVTVWDLSQAESRQQWYSYGVGLLGGVSAGQFAVAVDGDRILEGIYPGGVYTHGLSGKHPGRLTSPDLMIGENQAIWVEAIGANDAGLRYVVQDYPRNGTVYPVTKLQERWNRQRYDLTYWGGDSIHVELATAMDAPLLTAGSPRSWFGVRRVVVADKDTVIPDFPAEALLAVVESAESATPHSLEELQSIFASAIGDAVEAWGSGSANDAQALLLDECLRSGALTNSLSAVPELNAIVAEHRRLENEIPVPTRVPGLEETVGSDQQLMVRGNHNILGELVPRRFLEAIDDSPYASADSGRLQLSRDLLRDDNPLTKRVIVNRIWHHLFGRGIVSTPDNFGRLGAVPSHGELLDYLAWKFAEDGWSMKQMVRLIVTTQAWQRSSVAVGDGDRIDPDNVYLARASVRRLEAESIRDSLLSVSQRLDTRLYGAPVASSSNRRSVYVQVIRNSLDPFLRAFDFPEPFSSVGRRDVTNVPAQSLAMMNDRQVAAYADAWARQITSAATGEKLEQRLALMFLQAFGRQPSAAEIEQSSAFLAETRTLLEARNRKRDELSGRVDRFREQVDAMLSQARTEIENERSAAGQNEANQVAQDIPSRIADWDFNQGLEDLIGDADVSLHEGARLGPDGLIVANQGYALTDPLNKRLEEKTLEVWVKLANLDQRGGGAMTVQSRNGVIFDAIVFGERDPKQWLAGSNGFSRTQSFAGAIESEATSRPVHFVITYNKDGQITGYRNGIRYGRSYRSNGPQVFEPDSTIVGFGIRHLPAGGNRLLSGSIVKASLYDVALGDEQIAALASGRQWFVSEEQLLDRLTKDQREEIKQHRQAIARLTAELQSFPTSELGEEQQAWSELARALFSFQEFIYVR